MQATVEKTAKVRLKTNTHRQCSVGADSEAQLRCDVHSMLAVSQAIEIASASLADPDAGVHCSALTIVATGSSGVTADPSYHSYTECRCDPNSFGINARCYRCPEGCTCTQDTIQNCFPVVQRGSIVVSPADASGTRSVIAGSIAPFAVAALLPCPRTVTGASLCNPNAISWSSFYRIVESSSAVPTALMDDPSLSRADSDSGSDQTAGC